MSFGDGGTAKEARRARHEEEARQARITSGSAKVRNDFAHKFSPQYYEELMGKVNAFYQPEVDRQFAEAHQKMSAALRRNGLFDSWAAAKSEKDALDAKARADAEVTTRGLQAQSQRKQDVEFAQNQVLGQLTNTGDASAAFANAASAIKANDAPAITPMLGQVITDLTAGLATQQTERERQRALSAYGNLNYNPGRYTSNVRG